MELKGEVAGISVYDDFAPPHRHRDHPWAACAPRWAGPHPGGAGAPLQHHEARVHKEELAGCFDGADEVFFFQPPTSAGIWGGDGPHDPACPGIRGP